MLIQINGKCEVPIQSNLVNPDYSGNLRVLSGLGFPFER